MILEEPVTKQFLTVMYLDALLTHRNIMAGKDLNLFDDRAARCVVCPVRKQQNSKWHHSKSTGDTK